MGYKDKNLSSFERAKDLLGKMTLKEKIGQLNQRLYGFNIYKRNGNTIELTEEFCDEVEKWGGLGVLYGLYRADPWSDKDKNSGITPQISMNAYNMVQKYVIEHSRLGIPMMLSTECPHGHQALGGGLLPVNTALGATFDDELVEEAYAACGNQLKDGHVDLALMSVLDVLRDPRWGRSEECYSEDPYLSAQLARSAVNGMQSSGVYSVAKHLCAQGECTGGVNASAASIGERELRDIHLQSARAACSVDVKGIMAAYNEIDGIYCHANKHLLKDILRDEFGFDGIVMADGFAIDALDKVTDDNVASGALAINSGVDVSLWDSAFTKLEESVHKGYVSVETIDQAVLRVLKMKFDRGLFEEPYMKENMKAGNYYGIDKLSAKLAQESLVLLKNDDLLPLEPNDYKKVAVIGPNADSLYALMGDYTPPINDSVCKSVLAEARNYFNESTVIEWLDPIWNEVENDKEQLSSYDLLIVVGGGSSSRYEGVDYDINGAAKEGATLMDCGEGVDVANLYMQGDIERRVQQFKNIPVLSICIAGRPYVVEELEKYSNAFIYSFYPGPYGAVAIWNLITGKNNASGRLPASLPRSASQLPVYYNHKDSYVAMKYSDLPKGALHVFGEGLSYGKLRYGEVEIAVYEDRLEQLNLNSSQTAATVKLEVVNESDRDCVAVPQVYIHRIGGGVTSRNRELKAYKRVMVEKGQKQIVSIELTADKFYYYKSNMEYGIDPCTFEIFVMDNNELLGRGILNVKYNSKAIG